MLLSVVANPVPSAAQISARSAPKMVPAGAINWLVIETARFQVLGFRFWAQGVAVFRSFSFLEIKKGQILVCPFLCVMDWEWTSSGPESVLSSVCSLHWHSVSMSREVTWDHRSCHRRFFRRVTTAELILPCPDMPSTQRCRLLGMVERAFWCCQWALRQVKACTEPRHYDEKRGTAVPALRTKGGTRRHPRYERSKAGHGGPGLRFQLRAPARCCSPARLLA